MRRFRYSSVRRRVARILRFAGVALAAGAALFGLIQLQRSALRTLQASNNSPLLNPSPLLTLTGVEIRVRSHGKPLVHFTADTLTLARDLRGVVVTNIRGGADTPVTAMPGGSPIAFIAGDASLNLGPIFQQTANLQLSQASAETQIGGTRLRVAAPGLVWQWPHGLVQTTGEVNAEVGGFGAVQCASLSLDTSKKMITFGPFQATIALAALGAAASLPGQAATAPGSPAHDSNLHFYANDPSQTAQYSDNNKLFTINGPLRVVQGSVTMRTVGVVYNDVTKIATAQSPVTINDNQNTLTGEHGTLNFNTHIATLTGDVHMSAIPSNSDGQSGLKAQASEPTNLTCDHMTYNYRTKLADADGHLTVFQKDRTVTADTGHYDVNAQLVTMHGNVDGRSTDGKHLHAPEALVSVNPKDQWIQVRGPITYEFPMTDDENPLPPAARTSGSAPQPAPTPPKSSSPAAPAPGGSQPAGSAPAPASTAAGSSTSAAP